MKIGTIITFKAVPKINAKIADKTVNEITPKFTKQLLLFLLVVSDYNI
jgi:hypothetical protein